jgi:chromosome segregation protein
MLLKRLQLQGYKTFANKTDFVFDAGITAIVGPNGSGKSNIADAIRWVLGEQSYSELRGRRGTDMIFAGSQQRARAGMASAILTLDNSEGWLPTEFSEVEIGRRTYRTGENEYLLNGKRVRLRDVRDLLASSALAQRTYTLIGQGLIDSALSLRSEERRALFEEAAGISHYKERRAETLRRLQETRHNLERVHDLLSEIEPRLRSLRQQAARAKNHEQVATDLRHLLRTWYGWQWEESRATLREQRRLNGAAESAWKESRRHLRFVQEQIDEVRQQLHRYREQWNEKQAVRDAVREQLEQASRDVAIFTERQALVSRQLAAIALELPDLEQQEGQARAELEAATADLQAVQAEMGQEQAELARFEATFRTQRLAWEAQRQTARDHEQQMRSVQQTAQQEAGQLAELRTRLAERQQAGFDPAALESARAQAASADQELQKVQGSLAESADKKRQLQRERQELLRRFNGLRQEQSELNRRMNKAAETVARAEERARMLDQIRQKGSKIRGNVPVIGRFARFLTIPADYQTALEAALGTRLGGLLVADGDDLARLVQANREQPLMAAGQSALTPPAWPDLPALPGLIGPARAVVQCEGDHTPLADLLLGGIWLFGTEQEALAAAPRLPAGGMAVSADGTLCHAGGLVERRPIQARESVLAQEREWQAAREQVAQHKATLHELERELASARKAADEQQTAIDALAGEERKTGRSEQLLTQQQNQLQRDLDRSRQQASWLAQQQTGYAAEIARLEERIATLEQSQTGKREEIGRLEAAWNSARVALEALPVPEADQQRTRHQQRVQAANTIVAGRRAVVDSRRATLGQLESRLTRQRQLRDSLLAQQETIDLHQAQTRQQQLQQRLTTLEAELQPLRNRRDKLQGELSDLEIDLAARQKTAHSAETAYTEARLALNKQESRSENLRERIHADLGLVALSHDEDETVQTPLPMGEVVEQLPVVAQLPDDIADVIQRRRAQLQRMGAINPDAPEEYETTQQRYDFMTAQIADLQTTEEQLRKVIGELDTLTSREFSATVERVNGLFGEMFTRLFGGGSAELQLTDPDDLTVSGVDIIARLPRRRTQGLDLLSGGERALTATALIFALLKTTPPPFCVMDEVDAALDEANITRFREVVRELSDQTQFIIITHNRGTVQVANTIYGVSMTRESTSQLISLKPEDYVSSETAVEPAVEPTGGAA